MPHLFVVSRPFKYKSTEFYLSGLAVHLREEVALCVTAQLRVFARFLAGSSSQVVTLTSPIHSIMSNLFDAIYSIHAKSNHVARLVSKIDDWAFSFFHYARV